MNQTPHRKSLNGPGYLGLGFRLLTHRRLVWFVVIPVMINLAIFLGLTWYAVTQFTLAMNWVMGFIPDWLDFLLWIFWLLFALLLLVVYGYTFAMITTLIASPFYGILAEQAEYLLTGSKSDTPMTFKEMVAIGKRSLIRELQKMAYFLPRILVIMLVTLALSFTPGLNFLGPVVSFLWGSWSLSLQYVDYAADNHLVSFPVLRRQVSTKRMSSMSFGATTLVMTSIPLV
ncbi:MAG: sulfate transporter CysZ, partial [bacterium]